MKKMKEFQDFPAFFSRETGLVLSRDVLLSVYSSFRIGGPADYFIEVKSEAELTAAVRAARKFNFPFYVIGGGYNLLFDDTGYRGLMIRNRASSLKFIEEKGILEVASGTRLAEVVNLAVSEGLGGLEFLAGIPGTVGGAIYGNAGAFGQAIGDRVDEVKLLTGEGKEKSLRQSELGFGYRHSFLKDHPGIVLKASLRVERDDRNRIQKKVEDYLTQREQKHPPEGTACAGSYFKNPVLPDGSKIPAGRLLEQAGARGMRVGQAAVYPGHCNFIVNLGGATCREVLALAAELKEKVQRQTGICLQEEVIYVRADASML